MRFDLKKGSDIPITGEPSSEVDTSKQTSEVGILGTDKDYFGMKPTMLVKAGDQVKTGQPVFECKKNVGLIFTAPATGEVVAVNRGPKRIFESLVIKVSDNEEFQSFQGFKEGSIDNYNEQEIRKLLIESGTWTSIRQRPFEKVAEVSGTPNSIFVTAVDTNPLSPNPDQIVGFNTQKFKTGITVLAKLAKKNVFICTRENSTIEIDEDNVIKRAVFTGPHPAGNVGTHMHFLDPVSMGKVNWHVGYQDVVAIGHLFETGQIFTERYVALAGPLVKRPRVLKTRFGAKISELIADELDENLQPRVINGSILNGQEAKESLDYVGHFANSISIIEEDRKRELLGWHSPGFDKFSLKNIYFSKLFPNKKFPLSSNTNGSPRAIVPIGAYEEVTPLDILPTYLLRALAARDTDLSQDLGCLELAEEDIALFTFADPGKEDFGALLRENLTIIEKEG